jgi:hypothetical protein
VSQADRSGQREISHADWVMTTSSIEGAPSAPYRAAFTTLLAIVGLLLLIACANLASLFVTRNLARRKKRKLARHRRVARRFAPGLLVESAVVSTACAASCSPRGRWARSRGGCRRVARLGDLQVDGAVLAFACSVASATPGDRTGR